MKVFIRTAVLFLLSLSVCVYSHEDKHEKSADTSGLSIKSHINVALKNAQELSVLTVTFRPAYREPSHTLQVMK